MIVFIVSKGSYTEMIQTEISVKEALPEARVERLPEMNPGKVLNEILAVCREPFFLALYGGDTFTPAIKEELMSRIADMHPETGAVVLHPKGRSRPGSKQGFDAPHGILWRTAAVTPSAYGGFSESSHLPFSVYLWIERLFRLRPAWTWEALETDAFVPSKAVRPGPPLHQAAYDDVFALLRQPLEPPGPKHSENLSDPVISVVICTYNDAAYLPWAVRSVVAQSYAAWELIIVDDGSTDGTDEYVKKLKGHGKIRCLTNANNQGKAESLNQALTMAKGKWLLELDADDWLSSDCLLHLAKTALALRHEAAVYADHHEWIQRMHGQLMYRGVKQAPSALSAGKLLAEGWVIAPRMYRTSFLKKHQGWNASAPWGGRLFEDVELLARLSLKETLHYIALPLYHRRIRSSSVSRIHASLYERWSSWVADRTLSSPADLDH